MGFETVQFKRKLMQIQNNNISLWDLKPSEIFFEDDAGNDNNISLWDLKHQYSIFIIS